MGVTRREALAAGATALVWPAAAGARPGGAFCMVGVSWRSPARVRIELRVRLGDGAWSPWVMASAGGHAGDGRSGLFGEPVWVGNADQVQLRGASSVDGVRVHTIPVAGLSVPPSAARAASPLAEPSLPAGPGQPPIIARSAWAGGRARPRAGPFYGAIELAFVHHTDNPNGYARADVPAMLLAMFDYHRYVRGYYDIAYNFIIDAFGRVWEGRAGGIDEPVLGAHAGGFNGVSTGIAVLGTFMDSVPPPSALDALERLLAWKLSLHGVPARGEVRVEVNPADAYYTPFRPGQRVLLPRVAGHRDGDLTDCPGNAFYHRLPALRPRVAALAGPVSRLTVTPALVVVAPGATVTLHGRLLTRGVGVGDAPIAVQAVAGRRTLARVITDANGVWSASVVADRTVLVRALHDVAPAVISAVVEIGVAPVITLELAPGAPLRVRGTIQPPKAHILLDLYRGHARLSSRPVRVRRGTFSARVRLPGHGTFTIVARTRDDSRTVAGASPPLTITR
jgi:hypothetical protein